MIGYQPPKLIMQAVPELAAVGEIFRSTAATQLTEEGTEYCVTVTKHITAGAVVLQFDCTNTVEEQVLENVSVDVDLTDAVRTPSDCQTCRMCPDTTHCMCPVLRLQ